MKAVVILVGIFCLLLAIATMATRQPPTEEQVQAERQAQAEKLDTLAEVTDLVVNLMTVDGKVTKPDMKQLQKLVNKYKNILFYKRVKKELDPSKYPSLLLLTTIERITDLYFPSLGHACEKECLEHVRFLFNQLGAEVSVVEPNTGPRDILIGAIVFAAIGLFFYRLLRDFSVYIRLTERADKEKTST